MGQKKQSLVEEALLQMKNLEEALTENAKGILGSTMKQEISELVKESLSEEEIEDTDMEVDIDSEMEEGDSMSRGSEEMKEQLEDLPVDDEVEVEDDEIEMDVDDDTVDDILKKVEDNDEDLDDEEMDSDEMSMLDLPDADADADDEEALLPLDLTGASDEEILKVFKAMGEEDGIVITQDEDEIYLKDDEAGVEYEIHTESEDEIEIEDEDEVVYEIELDDDEYEHYRDAEKDDPAHIRDLERDMEDDSEKTEAMEGKWGGNKGDYHRSLGRKTGVKDGGKYGKGGHYKDYEEAKEGMIRSNSAGKRASSEKSKGLSRPHSIPNNILYSR